MNFSSHKRLLSEGMCVALQKDKAALIGGFRYWLAKAGELFPEFDARFWLAEIGRHPIEEVPMTRYGHRLARSDAENLAEVHRAPLQFGDLRVPDGPGPHPVAIFIHGGCWLSQYGISHSGKFTQALADNGIAVWSLEYRRVGDKGGGWPGTFLDIGQGADHLQKLTVEHNLDLGRLLAIGHSAGAQFALWLAARPQIPADIAIATDDPLAISAVLAMAPAADLARLHEGQICGHVIDRLMGGSPATFPDRFRWADPAKIALPAVDQILLIGRHDQSGAPVGHRYFEAAKSRGDSVRLMEANESGHFEMIDPDSSSWPFVLSVVREMLDEESEND